MEFTNLNFESMIIYFLTNIPVLICNEPLRIIKRSKMISTILCGRHRFGLVRRLLKNDTLDEQYIFLFVILSHYFKLLAN